LKEVAPMKKRIYKATNIKKVDVDKIRNQLGDRVVFGCDAAKEGWYAALMASDGEVVRTVRWNLLEDHSAVMSFLEGLRASGIAVEVAMEPTGTYADPVVYQLQQSGIPVYRVSPKHSHDYSEIYDGVPSSHDGKSSAVVAKLHLEKKSRLWPTKSDVRRRLRVMATRRDWTGEEIKRYQNRLEANWSRHWPEALKLLPLDTVSIRVLAEKFGDPAAVASNEREARETLRTASCGHVRSDRVDAIIASAKHTIGVPMIEAERALVQQIGVALR